MALVGLSLLREGQVKRTREMEVMKERMGFTRCWSSICICSYLIAVNLIIVCSN